MKEEMEKMKEGKGNMKKEIHTLWEVNKESIRKARRGKGEVEEKKVLGLFEDWNRLREKRKTRKEEGTEEEQVQEMHRIGM